MKVAVISSTVFPAPCPGYGGLEMVAYECAKGLAERSHDVTLIGPEGSRCPGGKVFVFGPPGCIDEKSAYSGFSFDDPNEKDEAKRKKRFDGYWPVLLGQDVVVDHSWQKHAYLLKMEGALTAPVLGVFHAPVNTMYGTWPPQCPDIGAGVVKKPCAVCISEDQTSHLRSLFGTDARVAYNGVCTDTYKPLSVPRTDRFLFLARFSSIKGADLALEACYRAGVGLDLIGDTSITGEPDYLHHCQQLARRESPGWDRSKGPQFRVLGGVGRGETVYWYSQAHAMLHPNERFREPFGLAPVEAMLCGCPVIAWDHGAMRETVNPSTGSVLVRSMDELVAAVNRMKAVEFSFVHDATHRCREWATKFSLKAFADRYDELVWEAVESPW